MANLSNTRFPVTNPYIGYTTGYLLSESRLEAVTEESAMLEATWDGFIKAPSSIRAYPIIGENFKVELADDEIVSETGIGGRTIQLYQKGGVDKFSIPNVTPKMMRKLLTFDKKYLYRAIVTSKGYIKGITDQATKTKFLFEKVYVMVSKSKDKEAESEKLTITMQSQEPEDTLYNGMVVMPSFDINDKTGLWDVVIAKTSATTTKIVATVKTDLENSPYVGLQKADFDLKLGATPVTITIATDNGDGSYDLAGTFATGSYTLALKAPALLTTGHLIEGINTLSITI